MWMRMKVGVLSVVFLTGCASAGGGEGMEAGPKDVDPIGSYAISTSLQGTPLTGHMRIRGEPDAYTGSIYTDYTGELRITSVTVQGPTVLITANTPDGPVDLELTFDGDQFTGTWWTGTQEGAVEGRRVSR